MPERDPHELSASTQAALDLYTPLDWMQAICTNKFQPGWIDCSVAESRITYAVSWMGPDGLTSYELQRSDEFERSGRAITTSRYNLRVIPSDDAPNEYFTLNAGSHTPVKCNSDWKILPHQDPETVAQEMITHLRTNEYTNAKHLEKFAYSEIDAAFQGILNRSYRLRRIKNLVGRALHWLNSPINS